MISMFLRAAAAAALQSIGAEEAVPVLARLARDRAQPQSVRIAAIDALDAFPGQVSGSTLMELLGRERGNVRMAAAAAAGVVKPEGGVPALATILRSRGEHDDLRRVAAVALGECGGQTAADAIVARLMDETERKRVTIQIAGTLRIDEHYVFWESALWASRALPLPDSLASRLQGWLNNEWYPDHFRRQVRRPLGAISDPLASQLLVEALDDPDTFVREIAASAVKQTKDATYLPKAVDLLENAVAVGERVQAAWAMGDLGDPAAIAPLDKSLGSDVDPTVRNHSAMALGALGAIDVLVRHLQNEATPRAHVIQILTVLRDLGPQASAVLPAVDAFRADNRGDVAGAARKAHRAISGAGSNGT